MPCDDGQFYDFETFESHLCLCTFDQTFIRLDLFSSKSNADGLSNFFEDRTFFHFASFLTLSCIFSFKSNHGNAHCFRYFPRQFFLLKCICHASYIVFVKSFLAQTQAFFFQVLVFQKDTSKFMKCD